MNTLKTEKFEMDFFTFGKGHRNLVIIPGVSVRSVMLSEDAIAGAYSSFADYYTVYVFDRIRNISEGYSVMDMADDTAEAMNQLGVSEADIFGTSQGGMIAMCIAIRHPEIVNKMVLASTAARLNKESEAVCRRWKELTEMGDISELNRDMTEKVYTPSFVEKYKDYFKMTENVGTADEMKRFSKIVDAHKNYDIYDELEKIKCPVLVIGAECDKVLSAEASEEIAEKLGCELYIYKGYGHAVYDEAADFKELIILLKAN